jgi:hypothetical protein
VRTRRAASTGARVSLSPSLPLSLSLFFSLSAPPPPLSLSQVSGIDWRQKLESQRAAVLANELKVQLLQCDITQMLVRRTILYQYTRSKPARGLAEDPSTARIASEHSAMLDSTIAPSASAPSAPRLRDALRMRVWTTSAAGEQTSKGRRSRAAGTTSAADEQTSRRVDEGEPEC